MKRKIIKIDEEKCNGCGLCIPDCPEGALQVIDGKARLISDLFCDGLGACIKACPQGAMTTEEREAEPYDENKVMENVVKGGQNVIKAHLKHLKDHGEDGFYNQAVEFLRRNNMEIPKLEEDRLPCGCPGTMQKDLSKERKHAAPTQQANAYSGQSELNNWPIQLKLINPNAPYLTNADLVIAADCTAFAYPNFHQKFLKGKVLIMLCPKLDSDLDMYIQKLTHIFEKHNINSITLVHMEVPCCGGVEMLIKEAMVRSGKNIIIKDYTVSIEGELV
ncbi:MAG: 4Fe-4S binding protein [Candidatus Gastranaerophilales bacterium]|jgi:ferredoxin|nr:4Fe-4S binding protein [Candidatus Gastranaerophilales bacterium]